MAHTFFKIEKSNYINGDRSFPRRFFPRGLFPAVFSPLGLFPAGFFPDGIFPAKKTQCGRQFWNAVEREPVETRVLNPTASEASQLRNNVATEKRNKFYFS